MYKYKKNQIKDFKTSDGMCFCLPNGLGGYTSQSIINSSHRKHYGYLIACLKPPVDRKMILTRINEYIGDIELENQKYESKIKDNVKYVESFEMNYIPTYTYSVNDVKMIKRLSPLYGSNTVAIEYKFTSKTDTTVYLEPLFNYRDHGDASAKEDLIFKEEYTNNIYTLIPDANKDLTISFKASEGELVYNTSKYTEPHYCEYDVSTGDDRLDTNYKPFKIKIELKANEEKVVGVLVSTDTLPNMTATSVIEAYSNRQAELIKNSNITDELGKDLVIAADTFICYRKSTNLKTILAGLPWFTDWGRDTMIAFTGLTLVTRRFDDAKEILKSFSLYEKNGLIPNMFPDDGGMPLYNTVDASLWYFYACYKYVEYTNDFEFIKNEIYPTLLNIIKAYSTHTDFSIYMDTDGLVHAGSDQDQVTWMDVRTNGVAVTPRHGKPVEINALWYNALMIMDYFTKKFGYETTSFIDLAAKVKKSFNEKFYNEEAGCLYDTVDPMDSKIRPNQIWVLSLPFKVLDKKYEKSVLDTVTFDLYNVYGLRSLSIEDPEFKPKYEGKLLDRDYAYHMGTTWGFLLGGYLDAFNYIYNNKDEVKNLVEAAKNHLYEGCINGFAEIFDGDIASRTRGCYTQAWSIGEFLRAYYENVLNK